MTGRCASKMRCQAIALAMPVSSSSVMKVTLPLPGRWRTRTMPATLTFAPSFTSFSAAQGRIPRRSSSPRRHARPAPDILDRREGRVHGGGGEHRAMLVGQALHLPQAKPEREIIPLSFLLQRAVPPAPVHADWPHLDAMLARVADELGGRV